MCWHVVRALIVVAVVRPLGRQAVECILSRNGETNQHNNCQITVYVDNEVQHPKVTHGCAHSAETQAQSIVPREPQSKQPMGASPPLPPRQHSREACCIALTLRSRGTSGLAFSLMVREALVCRTARRAGACVSARDAGRAVVLKTGDQVIARACLLSRERNPSPSPCNVHVHSSWTGKILTLGVN